MSLEINIYGTASFKEIKTINLDNEDLTKDLLTFLRENQIPIASSCDGEGVCKKCIINGEHMSCQISIEQFLKEVGTTILIAYL